MRQPTDQEVQKLIVWCEQSDKKLHDILIYEGDYILELNDGEKDFPLKLPQEYQDLDLARFIR